MPRKLAIRKFFFGATSFVIVFLLLRLLLIPAHLIVLLNGLFVGSIAAVCVAYWDTIKGAFLGLGPYDRVRQMTLSFFLLWLALALGAASSIYIRVIDAPTTALTSVALARYCAICAAIAQVYAPDWGEGLFHGRDRKVLTASLMTGLVVSVAVILLQKV